MSPVFHYHQDSSESESDEPRTCSTCILLSNGKPLKSSLKSSSSSPNIPSSVPNTHHTRARSAPSSPLIPKNVHFPSRGLETIRLFSRSAKPASLSLDDTETETESESLGFPFPRIPPRYSIDFESSSQIPAPAPSPHANVHLETIALTHQDRLTLSGTLLVRNLAYEKSVAVRFTLDDWHTTSEVAASHLASLPCLPISFCRPPSISSLPSPSSDNHPTWDRFSFLIHLEDYAHTLHRRTMWLVARYLTPLPSPSIDLPALVAARSPDLTSAEWWDNNGGRNYRVGFTLDENVSNHKPFVRRTAVSAPSLTTPPSSSTLPLSPPARSHTTLKKLSLSNYAAPIVVTPPADTHTPTHPVPTWHFPIKSPPLTPKSTPASETEITAFEANTTPPGVTGVHWAWGSTPRSEPTPTHTPTPTLTLRLPHTPRRSSPLASPTLTPFNPSALAPPGLPNRARRLSPKTSPGHSPPKLPSILPKRVSRTIHSPPPPSKSPSLSPSPSPSPTPSASLSLSLSLSPSPSPSPTPSASASSSSSSSPRSSTESISDFFKHTHATPSPSPSPLDADSLYQAFVRKWCFAGSEGGSVGAQNGNGAGVGVGVGVGTPRMETPRMGGTPVPIGVPVGIPHPGAPVTVPARKSEERERERRHEREERVVGF